jgi:hypothetical protein
VQTYDAPSLTSTVPVCPLAPRREGALLLDMPFNFTYIENYMIRKKDYFHQIKATHNIWKLVHHEKSKIIMKQEVRVDGACTLK